MEKKELSDKRSLTIILRNRNDNFQRFDIDRVIFERLAPHSPVKTLFKNRILVENEVEQNNDGPGLSRKLRRQLAHEEAVKKGTIPADDRDKGEDEEDDDHFFDDQDDYRDDYQDDYE